MDNLTKKLKHKEQQSAKREFYDEIKKDFTTNRLPGLLAKEEDQKDRMQ